MLLNPCFLQYTHINLGEAFTQPVDYFQFASATKKLPISTDAYNQLTHNVTAMIIGGGGIVRHARQNAWAALKDLIEHVPGSIPIAIWGMGINDHGRFDRNYDKTLFHLEQRPNVLIGLRDCFYEHYVPCVSCMRPEFDAAFTIQHELGLYVHHGYDIAADYQLLSCPVMSNQIQGDRDAYFSRVIAFLGSCDVVVTNTYHGAYWATLLNRKVIVIAPFSNKFFGFKHEPIIARDVKTARQTCNDARRYPNALSESRKANAHFYDTVLAFQLALTK